MIPPAGTPAEQLAETWDEIQGRITVPKGLVLVRTWPFAERIGRIWLPPEQRKFYKGLPHSKIVKATVHAVGPEAPIVVGSSVAFPQTFFMRYRKMIDGTFLGWVRWQFIHGNITLEASDLATDDPGHAAPAVAPIPEFRVSP